MEDLFWCSDTYNESRPWPVITFKCLTGREQIRRGGTRCGCSRLQRHLVMSQSFRGLILSAVHLKEGGHTVHERSSDESVRKDMLDAVLSLTTIELQQSPVSVLFECWLGIWMLSPSIVSLGEISIIPHAVSRLY